MRNQQVRNESEGLRSASEKLPIQKAESERTQRIREVIGVESVTAFGRRCGIGEATLRKYLNGAVPNTDNLVAIADAANVNIEWLAAGRGPKMRGAVVQAGLDEQLLARSIGTVEDGLRAVGRALPPDKHAKLIQAAYNLLGRLEASDKIAGQTISKAREQVVEFIKLAA
jgi:transcriptional regulator with XRE-family HTH domain